MKKLGVSSSFDKGYLAQAEGKKVEDNPYPKDRLDHQNWKAGFQHAKEDGAPTQPEEKPEL
jgi:hypothetical protein